MTKVQGFTLSEFVATPRGHRLWDSLEVRLIYNATTVFILRGNHDLELDALHLINTDTHEFTNAVHEFDVVGFTTIDDVNYIFIKDAEDFVFAKTKEAL